MKLRYVITLYLFIFLICNLLVNESRAKDVITAKNDIKRIIRYPISPTTILYKQQDHYFQEIFKLALEKSKAKIDIKYVKIPPVPQTRSVSLINNAFYDIHWMVSNTEREALLAPIRIPLYKGLIGLRLAFVTDKNTEILAGINTIEQLKTLMVGQGRDWPDSQILQSNQFTLMTTTTTNALFELLNIGRIDYFPRSIIEIWNEQKLMDDKELVIDKHIALYYPTAVYFFVRKNDTQLYSIVEKGLQLAIQDGSFDDLFNQYFGNLISKANLNKRKIFELDNPALPKATPLADNKLWIDLKHFVN